MAASYASKAEVLALAPELPDNAVLTLIVDTITQQLIDLDEWGDDAKEGHRTLAAHYGTIILNPSGVSGPVTARKIDKIGENYASGGVVDAELGLTVYGRMHVALRSMLSNLVTQSAGNEPPGFSLPDERIL